MWNTTARANTDLTFIRMILEDTSISPEDRLTIIRQRRGSQSAKHGVSTSKVDIRRTGRAISDDVYVYEQTNNGGNND